MTEPAHSSTVKETDSLPSGWRLAFVMAYPIRPNQGLFLSIGSGGNFGAGTDFDTIPLGYQYSWGRAKQRRRPRPLLSVSGAGMAARQAHPSEARNDT